MTELFTLGNLVALVLLVLLQAVLGFDNGPGRRTSGVVGADR